MGRITGKAVVVASLVGALTLVGCGSSGKGSATSTTAGPSSGGSTAETTTTAAAPDTTLVGGQPTSAVWPNSSEARQFTDPVNAARAFAVGYVGFVDPVVGAFQQGDSRSGEVPVRPSAEGPVTTVILRQLGSDDHWWVVGASTANIQLQSPSSGTVITSPVNVAGISTAFEAVVNVEIREDGNDKPLVEDTVMGGSMGEMGPFSKEITFARPQAEGGAIILKTLSAKDGNVSEATVVRVRFGS